MAGICAVTMSSCKAIARSAASQAVAQDSALFVATVRVLRDSVGPSILLLPEPLSDGFLFGIARRQVVIREWRERWLRSAGYLSPSRYEPCTGIFVIGHSKQGCPTTLLSVAQVSPVRGWGGHRVLDVSVRSLGPAGSSEERFRYVFARRGKEWTLTTLERGVVIE